MASFLPSFLLLLLFLLYGSGEYERGYTMTTGFAVLRGIPCRVMCPEEQH